MVREPGYCLALPGLGTHSVSRSSDALVGGGSSKRPVDTDAPLKEDDASVVQTQLNDVDTPLKETVSNRLRNLRI